MNEAIFSNSFAFREFRFSHYHVTDNRHGVDTHFLARMKKGRARFVSDREEIFVGEGDLFYIPLGCRYQSYWYGQEEIAFDSLAFPGFPEGREGDYPLQRIGAADGEAAGALACLSGGAPVTSASIAALYRLLSALLPRMRCAARSPRSRLVEEAERLMVRDRALTVEAVARACHVSPSGLYAAFRAERGETPVHTRQRLLAERGVELLRSTDLPVEEISRQLGFGTSAYFRRVLRRFEDRTPRQIRREGPGI